MNSIQWCYDGDASRFLRERGESIPSAKRIELVGNLFEEYAPFAHVSLLAQWKGVVDGISYLHDHAIVHGDLKPVRMT
jgi:serine/threonine protein kinase